MFDTKHVALTATPVNVAAQLTISPADAAVPRT